MRKTTATFKTRLLLSAAKGRFKIPVKFCTDTLTSIMRSAGSQAEYATGNLENLFDLRDSLIAIKLIEELFSNKQNGEDNPFSSVLASGYSEADVVDFLKTVGVRIKLIHLGFHFTRSDFRRRVEDMLSASREFSKIMARLDDEERDAVMSIDGSEPLKDWEISAMAGLQKTHKQFQARLEERLRTFQVVKARTSDAAMRNYLARELNKGIIRTFGRRSEKLLIALMNTEFVSSCFGYLPFTEKHHEVAIYRARKKA